MKVCVRVLSFWNMKCYYLSFWLENNKYHSFRFSLKLNLRMRFIFHSTRTHSRTCCPVEHHKKIAINNGLKEEFQGLVRKLYWSLKFIQYKAQNFAKTAILNKIFIGPSFLNLLETLETSIRCQMKTTGHNSITFSCQTLAGCY